MRRLRVLVAGLAACMAAAVPARAETAGSGEVLPPPYDETVRRESLKAALSEIFALEPDEIMAVREKLNEAKRARNAPLATPRQVSGAITASLEPGEVPVAIEVSANYVTVLGFYDASGAPWPVAYYQAGTDAYTVQQPGEGSHMLTITPKTRFSVSNFAVFLAGADRPLVFPIRTSDDVVEVERSIQVAALGPNANAAEMAAARFEPFPTAGNETITAFLNGAPPDGAVALRTTVPGVKAWRYDGRLYVRGRLTWISPSPLERLPGPSGVKVYVVQDVPVGLVTTADGEMREIRLGEQLEMEG